jgi:hypothetical protein
MSTQKKIEALGFVYIENLNGSVCGERGKTKICAKNVTQLERLIKEFLIAEAAVKHWT